jgi:hypothetical protein
MYGWVLRRLPFGLPGKVLGSVLLAGAAAALLWYLVFPAVDPYLPFNGGGVTTQDGPPVPTPSSSTPSRTR